MDFEGISCIGRINRSHGVRGEVKVTLNTEHTEIFPELDSCILVYKGKTKNYHLDHARQANKFWLFKFKEVNNRDEADGLKDNEIFVDENFLPALE
ncbi:MAG: hypothetical protein GY786_25310, partial [Proteobacteria bacterium]|nr:hypothetical protein [Pseudomonadota bacterium]